MSTGREKIMEYASHLSLHTLHCYVGMLETGEATVDDFDACGIDLEALARQFGSANCWTGTSGTLAAKLLKAIQECK